MNYHIELSYVVIRYGLVLVVVCLSSFVSCFVTVIVSMNVTGVYFCCWSIVKNTFERG